jgi:teichuronic acid biosynthesis glycosyltransferase TuaG
MLVTIIMPCYNSEKFIEIAIKSVINQTYFLWELIVVDDCSTDNSRTIVESYSKIDSRIKLFITEFNSGSPTKPRNLGIEKAQGRFIAFLDSDDIWEPEKLESQMKIFDDDNVVIVFSNYEKICENGFSSKRIIKSPLVIDYKKLLKGNVIACCTCVYDTLKVGKKFFLYQGHEDYAMWLDILRDGFIAKNTNLVSAKYRVRKTSVSSNKLRSIKWVYEIFSNNENFSTYKSIFYTFITMSKSFYKYLK